jgi:HPt (histidine-containing phosphotransfer) domain-containing protein
MTLPVFNAPQLVQLTLADATLQVALLSAFQRQLPGLQAELAAVAEADEEVFGELVHRLKGTAHFVAGDRLLALLREIEERPAPSTPAQRHASARQVARELAALGLATRDALRALTGTD